jgi:transcription-repair coupling factor (superfamily II helicase)
VKLDRVDGRSWAKRRVAVEHELDDTASRLTVLVKQRAARTARKLIPPPAAYERFVARFPFFPTPDQASAAEDVLSDLASGHPMDRLVCGDVGFGMTEVGLRAAAAAVLSGPGRDRGDLVVATGHRRSLNRPKASLSQELWLAETTTWLGEAPLRTRRSL